MQIDEVLLEAVPVQPEHASKPASCTHTCRHIPGALDQGKPLVIFPVRLKFFNETAMEVAMCRECYLRIPRENQVSKN